MMTYHFKTLLAALKVKHEQSQGVKVILEGENQEVKEVLEGGGQQVNVLNEDGVLTDSFVTINDMRDDAKFSQRKQEITKD